MSDFIEHKTVADRAASDRRRHRTKIEEAIKRGVTDVIAEESIIGKDGKKKIRIPVRGLKEYQFVYGDNDANARVGSAPGKDIRRGQKVGDDPNASSEEGGSEASDEAGEEYYDVEITLEELTEYLFRDLELPDLERKKLFKEISEKSVRHGYRTHGIRPRLDKKRSLKQLIKRRVASRSAENDNCREGDLSFHENDLRYRHLKTKTKESSSAVIFFLMDISGSMTKLKKYLARSFYFLLYHFIRDKYKHVDIVFIAHDMKAYEVNENQFFSRGNSGGTIVSTGLEAVADIIEKRYHPENWNVYCFQCSDGDNWPNDNVRAAELSLKLSNTCQLFGYCEIRPPEETLMFSKDEVTTLWSTYKPLQNKKFKLVNIYTKADIWPSFKMLFSMHGASSMKDDT